MQDNRNVNINTQAGDENKHLDMIFPEYESWGPIPLLTIQENFN